MRRPTPAGPADEREPAALLRRYRGLCEAKGLARAHRMPLAPNLEDELGAIEERLLDLLQGNEVTQQPPNGVSTDPRRAPAEPAAVPAPAESTGLARVSNAIPIDEGLDENDGALSDSPSRDLAALLATGPGPAVATVFTDGAAEGNPGPGGYCALIRLPGRPDRELSGGTNYSTNNKMELTAAIVGVRAAVDAGATRVNVVTDSEYLVKGMTRWLSGWQAKGWKTADGSPVKNRELWEQLAALATRGSLNWQWIRGHAGHPENERCDAVATAAARQAASHP